MTSTPFDAARCLVAANAAHMKRIAANLGQHLQVGDVVALSGPLGAGKTTFVQGLAEGLEVPSERHVASPTFALVNEHPGRVDLVHVDFYRVASPAELPELGLEEAYDRAVTAVEWAERFLDWLPTSYLHITIEPQRSGERVLCIASHGLRNEALALEILEDGLR